MGKTMQDNIRVEKERKYWDKYAPKYDRGIEKYWKSNLVTESGFIIRNEEDIREIVFPIAYIVAERWKENESNSSK
jgi:hypothetical protein